MNWVTLRPELTFDVNQFSIFFSLFFLVGICSRRSTMYTLKHDGIRLNQLTTCGCIWNIGTFSSRSSRLKRRHSVRSRLRYDVMSTIQLYSVCQWLPVQFVAFEWDKHNPLYANIACQSSEKKVSDLIRLHLCKIVSHTLRYWKFSFSAKCKSHFANTIICMIFTFGRSPNRANVQVSQSLSLCVWVYWVWQWRWTAPVPGIVAVVALHLGRIVKRAQSKLLLVKRFHLFVSPFDALELLSPVRIKSNDVCLASPFPDRYVFFIVQ